MSEIDPTRPVGALCVGELMDIVRHLLEQEREQHQSEFAEREQWLSQNEVRRRARCRAEVVARGLALPKAHAGHLAGVRQENGRWRIKSSDVSTWVENGGLAAATDAVATASRR